MPTTTPPVAPCRRHLLDLLFAIPANLRPRAHWRMADRMWDRIMADPELKSNWEINRTAPNPAVHWLFGVPVHLNGLGEHIDLIIPVGCPET